MGERKGEFWTHRIIWGTDKVGAFSPPNHSLFVSENNRVSFVRGRWGKMGHERLQEWHCDKSGVFQSFPISNIRE